MDPVVCKFIQEFGMPVFLNIVSYMKFKEIEFFNCIDTSIMLIMGVCI